MNYTLYCDGGSRGNPGPSALGAVLFNEDGTVAHEISTYLGIGTNNQAEYKALLAGLTWAAEHHARQVHCFLDSELVVKQMRREYRIKDPILAGIWNQVNTLVERIGLVTFSHVPRAANKHADRLVNQALDAVV